MVCNGSTFLRIFETLTLFDLSPSNDEKKLINLQPAQQMDLAEPDLLLVETDHVWLEGNTWFFYVQIPFGKVYFELRKKWSAKIEVL